MELADESILNDHELEVDLESNHRLIEMFRCPLCAKYMHPPILSCLEGHYVCCACTRTVYACVECNQPYEDGFQRHRVLEEMHKLLVFPCTWFDWCHEWRFGDQILEHEVRCRYNTFQPRTVGIVKWAVDQATHTLAIHNNQAVKRTASEERPQAEKQYVIERASVSNPLPMGEVESAPKPLVERGAKRKNLGDKQNQESVQPPCADDVSKGAVKKVSKVRNTRKDKENCFKEPQAEPSKHPLADAIGALQSCTFQEELPKELPLDIDLGYALETGTRYDFLVAEQEIERHLELQRFLNEDVAPQESEFVADCMYCNPNKNAPSLSKPHVKEPLPQEVLSQLSMTLLNKRYTNSLIP